MSIRAKLIGTKKSITIWFNTVVGMLLVSVPELKAGFPEMQEYLSPEFFKWGMGILVVANLLLRFRTNSGLEHKV